MAYRRVLLMLVFVTTCCLCDDTITPQRLGEVLADGSRRRKNPTADLPDLSRDELLAILDLIEKSGDPGGSSPVKTPTRKPTTTSRPSARYPTEPRLHLPSDTTSAPLPPKPKVPDLYPELPSLPDSKPSAGGGGHLPAGGDGPYSPPVFPPSTHTTTPRPAIIHILPELPDDDDHYPMQPTRQPPTHRPMAPPNYPAPVAPPSPATPKPKKSFFDKLIHGFMKILVPPGAAGGIHNRSPLQPGGGGGGTASTAVTFLDSFLRQLQQAQQSQHSGGGGGVRSALAASTQAAVLDNLVQRLSGQNTEGSQFVVNLVQTLKAQNLPESQRAAAAAASPVHPRQGGTAEQLLNALLRGVASGQQTNGASGDGTASGFLQSFQRELMRAHNPSAGPTGQRSAGDVILDSFKNVLQQKALQAVQNQGR